MKDKLIKVIREVPIADKTYEEYVEALADKLMGAKTNYERIKSMTIDDMASFFASVSESCGDFIQMADRYICQKCKKEHGGKCPVSDGDRCLYEYDDVTTLKYWLEGEVEQ